VSDWQDPFADDEAARERAARRAEREARRREREARESVGDRVREEMENRDPSVPGEAEPPAPKPPPPRERSAFTPPIQETPEVQESPLASGSPAPGGPPTVVQPDGSTEPPAAVELPTAERPVAPPAKLDEPFWDDLPPETPAATGTPPAQRPPAGKVRRRRAGALIFLGVLIVLVAAVGVFLSRRDDDEAPATEPVKGRQTIEVVVPEGYDRTQVAEVAKKAGLKGEYLKATESVKGLDLKALGAEDAQNLEGLLFPATYELFKGAKVETLVKKQLEAFEMNAAEINLEGAADELGFSPYEIVNVASMVEKEIAVPEERELAASVIYNRLDEGTPLGIDATIRFEDSDYDGQIVQSRLEEDTPYNTRVNAGLPPGPISNPGLASLEAAANPADTDFFYFVVKPGSCNEHTFVKTEAEFAQAEQAYQDALAEQGGSPTEC